MLKSKTSQMSLLGILFLSCVYSSAVFSKPKTIKVSVDFNIFNKELYTYNGYIKCLQQDSWSENTVLDLATPEGSINCWYSGRDKTIKFSFSVGSYEQNTKKTDDYPNGTPAFVYNSVDYKDVNITGTCIPTVNGAGDLALQQDTTRVDISFSQKGSRPKPKDRENYFKSFTMNVKCSAVSK